MVYQPPLFSGSNNVFNTAMEPSRPNPMEGFPGGQNLAVQMIIPQLMQALGNRYGMVPGSFSGTRNIYDQYTAQQYHAQQGTAMGAGQRNDQMQLQQMFMGVQRLVNQRQLTVQEQQQAATMASNAGQFLPMMAQFMGARTVDQFFGERGSSTLMAQSFHRGLRGMRDPTTGGRGWTGENAGQLASDVFNQLYGPNADIRQMRGMGAGEAGALMEELSSRGRLNLGPRGGGDEATVRSQDAQRISRQLKNMSGAVDAMRDIFGDMGRPDAPMTEIISALDALTNGKFAQMSPGRVEQLVRTTRNLAQMSGLGMQGMTAMMGQIGQDLAARGGPAGATSFIAQYAAASSLAYNDLGLGQFRGPGAMNREQFTQMQGRMMAGAASSQQANAQFAILRMADRLKGSLDPNSKLAKVAEALRTGADTVTYKGPDGKLVTERLDEMDLSNSAVIDMAQGAGLSRNTAEAAIADRVSNQHLADTEAGENVIRNTLRRQRTETLRSVLGSQFSQGLGGALKGAGVTMTAREREALGAEIARDVTDLSPEDTKDPESRRVAMRNIMRRRMLDTARNKLKAQGLSPAEIERRMASLEMTLTDNYVDELVFQSTSRANATLDQNEKTRGLTVENILQTKNDAVDAATSRALQEQRNRADVQAAFGGEGKVSPIRRIADIIREAKPGDDLGKLAARAFGFIDARKLKQLEEGPMQAMRDLDIMATGDEALSGEAMYDKEGRLTEAGRRSKDALAQMAKGMAEGGAEAEKGMKMMAEAILGKGATPEQLQQHVAGKLADKSLSKAERAKWQRIQRSMSTASEARSGQTIGKTIEEIGGEELREGLEAGAGEDVGRDVARESPGKQSTKAARRMNVDGTLRIVGLDRAILEAMGDEGDFETNAVQTQAVGAGST